MKKEVSCKIIFMIVLSIFLLSGVFAVEEGTCDVVVRSACDDIETEGYVVMGLSGITNAHGQEWDSTPLYTHVLCCNFGDGDRDCSLISHPIYTEGDIPSNKIIGLSSSTNAHAERPQYYDYDIDICYDGLTCADTTGGCSTAEDDYNMGILSLSGYTNAHIGEYGDYNINICCKGGECEGMMCEGQAICGDYEYRSECECDPCKVADGSELCGAGDVCLCEWDENDEECFLNVEEIEEAICGNGFIDLELDEQCDGDNFGEITGCSSLGYEGEDLGCYPSEHEQECTLDISGCTGGVTGGECGDNEINNFPSETCDCGGDGVCDDEELNYKTCEDFSLSGEGLTCHLPGEDNECTFDTTGCELGEGSLPSKIGKCSYDEDTEDDCEDKFLTYSWTATWTWADENIGQSPPCEEDYVLYGGLCYYDPNGASEKCVDGSNTVPCPAQIQLPFFGKYSVVMIITLIVLIYVFMKYKEKSSKKKKSK